MEWEEPRGGDAVSTQWLSEGLANASAHVLPFPGFQLSLPATPALTAFRLAAFSLTDTDHDPSKEARDARNARVAKNECQRLQNAARALTVHKQLENKHADSHRSALLQHGGSPCGGV